MIVDIRALPVSPEWNHCSVVGAPDAETLAAWPTFRPYNGTTFGRSDRCFCGASATREELHETGEPLGIYCAEHNSDSPKPRLVSDHVDTSGVVWRAGTTYFRLDAGNDDGAAFEDAFIEGMRVRFVCASILPSSNSLAEEQ